MYKKGRRKAHPSQYISPTALLRVRENKPIFRDDSPLQLRGDEAK